MNSITFLDDRYSVRTVYSDSTDWQRHAGWQQVGARNAALQEYMRVPLKQVLYAPEMHSGNVLVVSGEDGACLEVIGEAGGPEPIGGYDAMVTAVPGIMLCIWTADCPPLFLYDPVKNTAAIAHCGWRSICSGIVSNTIEVMTRRFGTNPQDAVAAFGPGICGKCYEVGGELMGAFSKRFAAEQIDGIFTPLESGKYLLDLRKAIALELSQRGVKPGKIHDVGICSYESKAFPSFRRNGPSEFGRQMLSGIVLV